MNIMQNAGTVCNTTLAIVLLVVYIISGFINTSELPLVLNDFNLILNFHLRKVPDSPE